MACKPLARLLLVALSVSPLNLHQRRLAILFLLAALAIAGLEIWGIASRLASLF